MARLYRNHKRTDAELDVMSCLKMSANKKHSGGIVINMLNAWNPETKSASNDPDHHIHMTESEACELIAKLAEALKP